MKDFWFTTMKIQVNVVAVIFKKVMCQQPINYSKFMGNSKAIDTPSQAPLYFSVHTAGHYTTFKVH